jgi:hypothetical protein
VSHILHLVKDPANAAALDVIRAQAADPTVRVSIVLLQDAVDLTTPLPGRVYRLHEPHRAEPPGPDAIEAAQLLDLIFAADSVVTW